MSRVEHFAVAFEKTAAEQLQKQLQQRFLLRA
jgi:hypothetical protein